MVARALSFSVFVILCGCHSITISTEDATPYPPVTERHMEVGIGQADLTPPPGYPMAGYSINGKISRGYWIKPKVTAVYIRDEVGVPFVVVTADLMAISAGLKHRVIELLNHSHPFIAESDLLLSATHSHHSIGVNFPDEAFSLASPGVGFDERAFEFTADRIVRSIRRAIAEAAPGSIVFAQMPLSGVAKNRSMKAYLRNAPEERQGYFNGKLALQEHLILPEEEQSMIDQTLSLFIIRNGGGDLKGVLATYAVHPTTTGDKTEVYSADVFGLAAAYSEGALAENGNRPIVAFFNGAEGDVTSTYEQHDRGDAVRIARLLSDGLVSQVRTGVGKGVQGRVFHWTKRIDIADRELPYHPLDEHCYCQLPTATVRTSSVPVAGAGLLAGASDGRTAFSSFGIGEGVRDTIWDPEQGYKKQAGIFLAVDILGIRGPLKAMAATLLSTHPGSELPISIHAVGQLYVVGLPAEFSTMLGRRIRRSVAEALGIDKRDVILVGLADDYSSYITTPCEYNEQAYEGASDYFGISAGQLFVEEYRELAISKPPSDRKGRKYRYATGNNVEFGAQHLGRLQVWDAENGLKNLMVDEHHMRLIPHRIKGSFESSDTVTIRKAEVVVFSYQDSVRTLGNTGEYYPTISLVRDSAYVDEDGSPDTTEVEMQIPECIVTVDEYSMPISTWTVRILGVDRLPPGAWKIKLSYLNSDGIPSAPVRNVDVASEYFIYRPN